MTSRPWGSAPDPGIFEAWAPVSEGENEKAPHACRQTGPAPSTHRRLGYSLPGCVPAEPSSASPSEAILQQNRRNASQFGKKMPCQNAAKWSI